ncbi:hypothetical protein [Caulobacter hibisci]|uniref:Uncharacterized protein n=1 Tax=Caulobacter hibisci TaxID=2035993 RepID=A0ABS0T6H1_9CAUL|nr:hypothetical protein [Caulobacter hibisci]MBI1686467.1 hypothetical protein [Caulobacter hibisci]
MVQATYASRLEVSLADETAMIRVATPSGPIEQGVVTNAEVARLVISLRTLRELANILNQHVATLDAKAVAAEIEAQMKAERILAEKRSFGRALNVTPLQ